MTWTGTWRDTRWEDRRAESESIGAVFVANGIRADAIQVPASMAAEPMWRNTTVNGLVAPGYETLTSGGLGFEWDTFEPSYTPCLRYPPAIKFLSSTAINLTGNAANEDGSQYNATINPCTHRIVAYKAGDALVVNFGTNQWGWGLSDEHVRGRRGDQRHDASGDRQPARRHGLSTGDVRGRICRRPPTSSTSWTFPTLTSLSIPATATVAVNETTCRWSPPPSGRTGSPPTSPRSSTGRPTTSRWPPSKKASSPASPSARRRSPPPTGRRPTPAR